MSPALPPSLQRQFAFLERRLWQMDALVALAGGAGSLLLSFFFQCASDRLWDTPPWLRAIFAAAGWAGFVFFAWQYGARWVWRRRSTRDLAVIVQRRYRRLGDRLLGIVELADPGAHPASFSPELCRAAIDQVAGEASSFEFRQAVATRKPRKYLAGFVVLAGLVAIFAIAAPQAGWNALLRWIWPASNVARYTFVTLGDLPDRLVVAQGEPFEITVGIAAQSFWHPQKAECHFDGQPASEAPIHGNAAVFQLPGQTQPRTLWLGIGDATRSIRIEPELRPDLRQISAHIDLPGYLKYPPLDEPIAAGVLNFLPGTNAVFTGEAVRDLGSAELQAEKMAPLHIQGNRFQTAPMLLEREATLRFAWKDRAGLAGSAPASVHLVPKEDAPPDVEMRGIEAAIAVLPGEVVPIDLASSDDYGVKRLSLTWQIGSPSPDVEPGPVNEIKIADGQPRAGTLGGHYDFSALLLEISEDSTVLLRATSIDYYPGRTPSETPVYRIHVLSPEEHARLVHDQFEKLMAQLEELARKQEKLLQAGQEVKNAPKPQLASPETAGKLGEQAEEQRATAEQLSQLASKTADVLKEAMRNNQIAPSTLQEWAQHAQAMKQLANSQMPAAAQSLSSAQADPSQRAPNLDSAVQQEQKILEAMRKMESDTNQSLERLMAQTLSARLRRAAATEQGIGERFQKMLPDDIGLTPAQIPADARQALDRMTASHDAVTRETGRVHEEVSRLFDRTSLSRYGDVAKEMEDAKTEDALAALSGTMKANVGIQSIAGARHWSEQLGKWADRLAANDQGKSNPNAQNGSQDSAAQMQALLALMRLRQQQEQTRDQTAALDERKADTPDYSAQAQTLQKGQSGLHDSLQALQQDPAFPIPARELAPPGKAMGDAASALGKPDTGKPATDAQADAINLLDAVIQGHANKSGASMAALMQMMGIGAGNGGKGSMAGGTPSGPNVPVTGPSEGPAPDTRPVPQSVGLDGSTLPREFRDAIESYHRAIEKSSLP